MLGSVICVYNFNNDFLVKNILRCDDVNKYNWYHLIDLDAGKLRGSAHKVISSKCGREIEDLLFEIVKMRNRIVHSFQITDDSGNQILATKEKVEDGNAQFCITEEYLLEFFEMNQYLSELLDDLRSRYKND